jgi:hypothetical protein
VIDQAHPEDCRFCPYPIEELNAAIEGFRASSGLLARDARQPWDPPADIAARLELFEQLPRADQSERVAKAQGYNEDRAADIVKGRIEAGMAYDEVTKAAHVFDRMEHRQARLSREADERAKAAAKPASRRKAP